MISNTFGKVNFRFSLLCLLIPAMAFIGSCGNANEEPQSGEDTLQKTTAIATNVNAGYPFGSALITQLTLPKRWEADPENYGSLKSPDGPVFDSISLYYSQLNRAPVIAKPEFRSVKVIHPLSKQEFDVAPDSLQLYHLDSCRYRLPDTDKYECYYFSKTNTSSPAAEFGNLLFISKDTRTAGLVQAYHMQGGEQSVKFQFFIVNKEEISLYSGWYYDDGMTLKLKEKLSVLENL